MYRRYLARQVSVKRAKKKKSFLSVCTSQLQCLKNRCDFVPPPPFFAVQSNDSENRAKKKGGVTTGLGSTVNCKQILVYPTQGGGTEAIVGSKYSLQPPLCQDPSPKTPPIAKERNPASLSLSLSLSLFLSFKFSLLFSPPPPFPHHILSEGVFFSFFFF